MSNQRQEQFVAELTRGQDQLYRYIYSLLADHSAANDVLQEANLVLWRKIDQFDATRPFLPWAYAIARYQVLAFVRDRGRDRLLLDAELVAMVALEVEADAEFNTQVTAALRACLEKISASHRSMLAPRRSGRRAPMCIGR